MILAQNENPEIWKENILNSIKDISDIELQKQTWSGTHTTNISSFTESLAILYDDFDFKRYIEYYKSIHGENSIYNLFFELDEMIGYYKHIGYNYEKESDGFNQILNDTNWVKITKKAKELIDVFL